MKFDCSGNDVTSVRGEKEDLEEDNFELEKEFVSETSCHGIFFWYRSRNVVQRVFWVLLVIGE